MHLDHLVLLDARVEPYACVRCACMYAFTLCVCVCVRVCGKVSELIYTSETGACANIDATFYSERRDNLEPRDERGLLCCVSETEKTSNNMQRSNDTKIFLKKEAETVQISVCAR